MNTSGVRRAGDVGAAIDEQFRTILLAKPLGTQGKIEHGTRR